MSREPRRPVIRWGVRLFRRDWRQQLLVIGLLVFAVAAASFGSVAAYAAVPSLDGEFGDANARIEFRVSDVARLGEDIAGFRADYGEVDVIARRSVAIPGAVEDAEFRAQSPTSRFGRPMLALVSGRYPRSADEVALTDGVARDFNTAQGEQVEFDGRRRTVVGMVENPARLDDEFALAAPGTIEPHDVTVLVGSVGPPQPDQLRSGVGYSISQRGEDENVVAAAVVLVIASIMLGLVGLVAAAGFAVVAHRRQRQLGMLASIGATDRQLRAVMLSNGIAAGVAAAVIGSSLAGVAWLATNGVLGRAFGQRIDAFDVPWWAPTANAALAVVAATAAAWWPARAVTRIPVTDALSNRPPRPGAAHRSLALAIVLLVGGLIALERGVNTKSDDATVVLLIPGALATAAGFLALSPLAIRGLARVARRAPLGFRLAARELNRHQARSGAALAALTLGVGISVATIVIATASQRPADEGGLSARQLVVRSETETIPTDRARAAEDAVRRIEAELGGARSHALFVPMKPVTPAVATTQANTERVPIALARRIDELRYEYVSDLYVATPELVARTGVTPQAGVDIVTTATDTNLAWLGFGGPLPRPTIQRYEGSRHWAEPTSLITEAGMAKAGAAPAPRGWFLEADHALTEDEISTARAAAASARLEVLARDRQAGLASTRAIATAAGVVVALSLLALTVGLIRSEAGRDLQTLVAAGATSFTRRTLSAATSGSLAFLGSVLGIAGAYVALSAIYLDTLSDLESVPLREISVLLFGLPMLAAAVGFVLSGREPAIITRKALD